MQGADLVRSVRRGRRVELVEELSCQGQAGAGLFVADSLEAYEAYEAYESCSKLPLYNTSVHNVLTSKRYKIMADRFHSIRVLS